MKPIFSLSSLTLLAGLCAVTGCASPDPDYFTLSAQPGTVALQNAPRVIALRRVGLAGYLDRDDLVDSNSGTRLRIANNQRWAEPLGDMIGRVLAEDLGQRLPRSTVFSEAGSIAAEPDATVEIDVQRLDAGPDHDVTLIAQVAISHGGPDGHKTPVAVQPIRLHAVSGAGSANRVNTMSLLIAQMADQIAGLLRGS